MKKKESNNKPQSKKGVRQKSSYFTCLRHPEVKKNKPGKCPKCGNILRLKK